MNPTGSQRAKESADGQTPRSWGRVMWDGEKQHTEGSITSESCPWKMGPAASCSKKKKNKKTK